MLTKGTFQRFQADDGTYLAAGITYYALLSLFPLLLGAELASVYARLQAERVAQTMTSRSGGC